MAMAISLDTTRPTNNFFVSEIAKTATVAAVSILSGMVVRYLSGGFLTGDLLKRAAVDAIIPVAIQVSFIASKAIPKIIQYVAPELTFFRGSRFNFLATVGSFLGVDRLVSFLATRNLFDLPNGPFASSSMLGLASGAIAWIAGSALFDSINAPRIEVAVVETDVLPTRDDIVPTSVRVVPTRVDYISTPEKIVVV